MTQFIGHNYIGGQRSAQGSTKLHSVDAATGETLPQVFFQATPQEVDAAAQAAAAAAAQASLLANIPFDGRTDGAEIFNNSTCTGCHTAGIGGAPKLDAAGIGARLAEQGIDTLVSKAITGFQGTAGVMPAKGGNPALTDEQVKATVEWMVAQSK